MNRKLKIFLSIVIGIIITNLIQLPLPEYLVDSKIMIRTIIIGFVWFLIFVGISNLTYRLLNRKFKQ